MSTINGNDTGVENVGAGEVVVEYDPESKTLRCSGLGQSAEVTVVNLGGVQLATKAVAAGEEATVSLAAQPKGSYLAIIKSAGTVRTHKFLKW